MTETDHEQITLNEKLRALWQVMIYRPILTAVIILLSIFAALMEGIGLSFLIPIIEIAQDNQRPEEMNNIGQVFLELYNFLGIPFELSYVILGVSLVMVVRYTASFLVAWLKSALKTDYVRHLQTKGFQHALNARVAYYDEKGSDEVLNALVTQAEYAGRVITNLVRIFEQSALSLVYMAIALYIAPVMTVLTVVLLGSIVIVMRIVVTSGYQIGNQIADANERIHQSAQAGTQGIRDVKVFKMSKEIYRDFSEAADQYFDFSVKKARNESAMDSLYQLLTAITVFGLIYLALTFASLSVAALGIFLFSIFRLAPRASTLNNVSYKIASDLPHLVRTQAFIHELFEQRERDPGNESPPARISEISFEDIIFSYAEEPTLNNVSFKAREGEFIAFVGPSGAGKSTIVSLIMRLYEPESGQILSDGTPIEEYELEEWREKVSMVRQNPYIFNRSIWYNVTIGRRDVDEEEIRNACEIARVTDFLDELPDGLDTVLGDDGVRLSGGQRQRIAIARALLDDSDILILDEATSDLDTSLEDEIQSRLESSAEDRILIVIAHRLSTVENADRIYAMEDGEITEYGPHTELLDQDGTYAELYSSVS